MKRPLPSCDRNQQIKVYRNLSDKCLSVMHKGLVTGHATEVYLKDVVFTVSESGRQRCLREKRKNVHAFVKGKLLNVSAVSRDYSKSKAVLITYNPYKSGSFYIKETGECVTTAETAVVTTDGIYAWGVK